LISKEPDVIPTVIALYKASVVSRLFAQELFDAKRKLSGDSLSKIYCKGKNEIEGFGKGTIDASALENSIDGTDHDFYA
jgi:hypothetical protein